MPFPTPGDLLDPRIEPASLRSPALVGGFFTTGTTWEAPANQKNVSGSAGGSPGAVEEVVLLQPLQACLCGDPWICQQAKPLPRLGIRNAPRCFPRGRDECALTQLLSRWSSVRAAMVICETESVHPIPSPPRTPEVPTSR